MRTTLTLDKDVAAPIERLPAREPMREPPKPGK